MAHELMIGAQQENVMLSKGDVIFLLKEAYSHGYSDGTRGQQESLIVHFTNGEET